MERNLMGQQRDRNYYESLLPDDALCNDIAEAYKSIKLGQIDQDIANIRENPELSQSDRRYLKRMEQIRYRYTAPPHFYNIKDIAFTIPDKQLAEILKKHGIDADEDNAQSIVEGLPPCRSKATEKDLVSLAIMEGMKGVEDIPSIKTPDNRASEFDPPSEETLEALRKHGITIPPADTAGPATTAPCTSSGCQQR